MPLVSRRATEQVQRRGQVNRAPERANHPQQQRVLPVERVSHPQQQAVGSGAGAHPAPGAGGHPATPGTPATNPAPPAPFLTPAQHDALGRIEARAGYQIAAINAAIAARTASTNQQLASVQHQHDVSTDVTNQSLAARGLFQSSIRDSDLNDLDATLTIRQNALNTALHTYTLTQNAAINHIGQNLAIDQHMYDELMVQNAQGVTPALPTPGTPGTPATTGAAGAAAQAGVQHAGATESVSHTQQVPTNMSPENQNQPRQQRVRSTDTNNTGGQRQQAVGPPRGY